MDAYTDWRVPHQPQAAYNSPRLNSLVIDYSLAVVDMALLLTVQMCLASNSNSFSLMKICPSTCIVSTLRVS